MMSNSIIKTIIIISFLSISPFVKASQELKIAAAERWFNQIETLSPLDFKERFAATDGGYYYKTLGNVKYGVSMRPSDNQFYENRDGAGWVALGNYKTLYRSMKGQPIMTIGRLSGSFYNELKQDAHVTGVNASKVKSILVDGRFNVTPQQAALIKSSYDQGYAVSLLDPTPNGARRFLDTLGLPQQEGDQGVGNILIYGVAKNNRVISIDKPSSRPFPLQAITSDYIEWVRDTDRIVDLKSTKDGSRLSVESEAQHDISKIASAQTFEKVYTYKGAVYSIQSRYWTVYAFQNNKNYVIAEVSPMLSPGSAYSVKKEKGLDHYRNITSSYKFQFEIWGRNNTDTAKIVSSSPQTETGQTSISSGTDYSIGGDISTGGISFSGGASYSSSTTYSIADISVINLSASQINNAAWLFNIYTDGLGATLPSVSTIGTFNPHMSWVWQIDPPSYGSILVQQKSAVVMKDVINQTILCKTGCAYVEEHGLAERFDYSVYLAK